MFLSCRPRIWCVSDDSELSAGRFGLTEHYEKHFGVIEQEVLMIAGACFLRFFEIFWGAFLKNPKVKGSLETLLRVNGDILVQKGCTILKYDGSILLRHRSFTEEPSGSAQGVLGQ